MTLTLRQTTDARATTKGSALTYAEMDANFIHALDEGTIVVGDDSSGSTIKLGDTLKIAGGSNITTAMSGNTLTITGGVSQDIVNDTSPQLGGNLDVQAASITTSTSNGDILLSPNGDGKVDIGTGSATGTISSNGAHNLKLETNDGTNSSVIEIVDGTNGDIVLKPNGNGNIKIGSGGQSVTVTTDGAHNAIFDTNDGTNTPSFTLNSSTNGLLEFTSPGTGGAQFKINEDPRAYPTGAIRLQQTGANNAEIFFGQYNQGPAVGTPESDNIQYFSVYFDPNENAYSRPDSSAFAGDANIFFGFDYSNEKAVLQGNGGTNGFEINSFGNNSNSYGKGKISIQGSYAAFEGSDPFIQLKDRTDSTNPSQPSGAANMFARSDAGSTVEMFVQDSANNVTKISPHNDQGDWEYYSRNTATGKTVRVNMEKMIRKLEDITGETFFEEFIPARS